MHRVYGVLFRIGGNHTADVLLLPLFKRRARDDFLSTERQVWQCANAFHLAAHESIYLRLRAAQFGSYLLRREDWIGGHARTWACSLPMSALCFVGVYRCAS